MSNNTIKEGKETINVSNDTIKEGKETIDLENGIKVEFEGYYLHNKPYYGKIKKYKNNELIMAGGFTCLDGNPTYNKNNYNGEITEYKNGKILHTGRYRYKGAGETVIPEGKHVYYHDNDKIKRIETYNEKGELDGEMETYDVAGNLKFHGTFTNGVGNGTYYNYNNNYNDKQKCYEGGIVFLEGLRTRLDSSLLEDVYPSGDGKEYNCYGRVSFEGEYSHGRRHGHGKEYDINGNFMYEGEYRNGELKYIKEYKDNGNLIYVEYNGSSWQHNDKGHGKEYDANGKLIFEGEYSNGRRVHGKEYDENDRVVFEGEYDCNCRKHGKEYDKNGRVVFEGDYKQSAKECDIQPAEISEEEYNSLPSDLIQIIKDDYYNDYGKECDDNMAKKILTTVYETIATPYNGKKYIYNQEGQLIKTERIENGEVVQQNNDISNENKINLESQNGKTKG